MNEQKLSYRLERVCAYLPNDARFADIGSDHAYLPSYAILHNKASFAVAGEVVKGPYESARHQVEKLGLEKVIHVRMGDGLEVVKENDCLNAITIAGMGGALIASILENGKDKLNRTERLILQPNIGAHAIRTWLCDHHYIISTEEVLEEDGKIYEIIVAEPTEEKVELTAKEIYIGSQLTNHKNEVFLKKWSNELAQLERVKLGLEKASQTEEVAAKLKEVTQKITWINEELI